MSDETRPELAAMKNNDRHRWRETPDDYYAPSIHVTEGGGVGINVGGNVIIHTLREWHAMARDCSPAPADAGADDVRADIVAHVVVNDRAAYSELESLCGKWHRNKPNSLYIDGTQSQLSYRAELPPPRPGGTPEAKINRRTWTCPWCGGYDGGGLYLHCSGCGRAATDLPRPEPAATALGSTLECEACGTRTTEFRRVETTNGGLNLCRPCNDEILAARAPVPDAVREALETAIRWLRRLEQEYPGCLNPDAIDKHLRPAACGEAK